MSMKKQNVEKFSLRRAFLPDWDVEKPDFLSARVSLPSCQPLVLTRIVFNELPQLLFDSSDFLCIHVDGIPTPDYDFQEMLMAT